MVDLFRKEIACEVKGQAMNILVQLHEDECYAKEKVIQDLTELIEGLDRLEEKIKPIHA